MTGFEIKGWCPGALRPMESGDGLVVRVRPHGGQLAPNQALAIAHMAKAHGNGLIDLSSRANLQIRGVTPESYPAIARGLAELGLLDDSPQSEAERNILVSPFWTEGDGTQALAAQLESALAAEPLGLPAKFGFAIDCGERRVLATAAADIRIERGEQGGLVVRADGTELGRMVSRDDCISSALSLARWFVDTACVEERRGRMARHIRLGTRLPSHLAGDERPVPCVTQPLPGVFAAGALAGIAFGQMRAETLEWISASGNGIRLTPWRMVLIEGLDRLPNDPDLITRPDDPMLRVVACTGAPDCPQALGVTRPIARRLAASIPAGQSLHVSGCQKGCAHPASAPITLVATKYGYDLVRGGRAADMPLQQALRPETLDAVISAMSGAS
jgi:precorrin-3B synthase